VTVFASDWLELDAEDPWVQRDAELALQQELSYAAYLNIHTVVLPPPRSRAHVGSYARAVAAGLARHSYLQIAVRIPIYHPAALRPVSNQSTSINDALGVQITLPAESAPGYASDEELNVSWDMWDAVRSICDYNQRLCIGSFIPTALHHLLTQLTVLDLTPPLPVVPGVLSRWLAEPVKYLYLPASTFIGNAKGYPVLPKGTQTFIRDIMAVSFRMYSSNGVFD
jgi:protein arginine N-methyltransferase 5